MAMQFSYLPWQPLPEEASQFCTISLGPFVYEPPMLSCLVIAPSGEGQASPRRWGAWRILVESVNAFRYLQAGTTPDMPDFINADGVCLVRPSGEEHGPATWEVQGTPLLSHASRTMRFHHDALANFEMTLEVVALSWQSAFVTDDWPTYYHTRTRADIW